MKKLFTLVALLAMALGANAKVVVDTEFDYKDVGDWTEKGGWASDAAKTRISVEEGYFHFHSEEAVNPFYDVQFQAFGVKNLNPDAEYTIEFRIKGSVAQDIHVSFSGCDTPGTISVTTDWKTVTFKSTNNPNNQYWKDSGKVLFQCGDYVGDWWISNVKITHEEEDGLVEEYVELLTNGDAEKAWADPNVKFNDDKKNFTICAWGKVKGVNTTTRDGKEVWDPFPATIEAEQGNPSNHVFVVHAADADSQEGSAWDNQFWIQAPKAMMAGKKYKVSFRYKASQDSKVQTQIHNQNPSDYKTSTGLGEISFTQDWQTFEDEFTATGEHADGWSFAFNLNSENVLKTDFYFDDITWKEIKLDEGYFITTLNADGSPNYNNAVPFKQDGDDYTITIGTEDAPVSAIMISTIYGTPSAFKGGSIKPANLDFVGIKDEYESFKVTNNNAIKLPGVGVWEIAIMGDKKAISIILKSGKMYPKIEPNPTNIVVKAQERDDLADGQDVREEEGGTGQTWDNQFFIIANRPLKAGESTTIKFWYKSSLPEANTTTQYHERPGNYIHHTGIGDVKFTDQWQEFTKTFTVPNECNGEAAGTNEETGEVTFYKNFQSIAFNMAEIKEACDYEIKDVIWMLEDGSESLIDQTGAKNFNVKEGAGTTPYIFGTDHETAINNVVVAKKNNSTVKFNLAGQRVSNDYKGMVIDGNGNKYLAK